MFQMVSILVLTFIHMHTHFFFFINLWIHIHSPVFDMKVYVIQLRTMWYTTWLLTMFLIVWFKVQREENLQVNSSLFTITITHCFFTVVSSLLVNEFFSLSSSRLGHVRLYICQLHLNDPPMWSIQMIYMNVV